MKFCSLGKYRKTKTALRGLPGRCESGSSDDLPGPWIPDTLWNILFASLIEIWDTLTKEKRLFF